MPYILPSKISSYLRRLAAEYASNGDKALEQNIILSCRARVEPETAIDNWNGGTYGHDVWLYLPLDVLSRIGIRNLKAFRQRMLDDLNLVSQSVENEFFRELHLEEVDEEDFGYQIAQSINTKPNTNPDAVSFWKPGLVRLFISHRDIHKAKANALAEALDDFGISSFVAHNTIEPMSEWRKEIMKGLETMEVMLVFLTDDFQKSTFTNQEVGYALGAGKPIISLKLGASDPPGFISHEQALRANIDDPKRAASMLYPLISQALGTPDRLHDGLISSFTSASSYNEVKDRFDRLTSTVKRLKPHQLDMIISAYAKNSMLHSAFYLTNNSRLTRYLEAATGRSLEIRDHQIKDSNQHINDDLPF